MILHSNSLKKFIIPYVHSRTHSFSSKIISYYSNLIDKSLITNISPHFNPIHAQLMRIGMNSHTFLGNRLIDYYSKCGIIEDALKVFDEMPEKNCFTWNVMLMGFLKVGLFDEACELFDEMPERDVVSWNSMISGYVSKGDFGCALDVFVGMQMENVKPSAYTYSIVMSCLSSAFQGKELHCSVIRSGLTLSNVVLCNGLIDMYSKLKLIDYAFGVFLTMKDLDVISWNTLILGCGKSDYGQLALVQFCSMRTCGYAPDQHTLSIVITVCSNLLALENGKQVFALCVKMGFCYNTIVISAAIDMFSKCYRLEDSVRLFEEMYIWDVALCNSMISCYVRHGFEEDAFWLFVRSLRAGLQPTEFTLSSILTCSSCLVPVECGTQIHTLVIKLGMESETIAASSLVDMYAKMGLIDSAARIFFEMTFKDLVSWNTMIIGFARNGRELEALETFNKLLDHGVAPDRITLAGVLLACSHRGLLSAGSVIFSSMEKEYGVIPGVEHYACVVDMMCRAGKLSEAMEIVEAMPHAPNAFIWESLLHACKSNDNLELTERVAETLVELEPHLSLPYLVLAEAYEMRCRWESVVRVKKTMKDRGIKKYSDCSWIGIKNQVSVFDREPVFLSGSEQVYSILRLLVWEMANEGFVCQIYADTTS
ncbi:hypothetical protein ACHQM5_022889 [Ranunculus cassubicifolius]